ncbi:MAG TPA: S24 family peptidase [Luteimonas sp.]|nr:S24 family peptidase [Luteimonas sp.]
MNRLAANLRELMDREGKLSENQLSRNTGVPQPTIHRILNGKVGDPRDGTVRPLAEYFGVTPEQLRTQLPAPGVKEAGAIPAYRVKAAVGREGIDPSNEILIAEVDMHASAGPGATAPAMAQTQFRMTYQLSWFQAVGARPIDVVVMKVRGDSMERTLFHGDRVAINTADREIADGKVYVFATGGVEPDIKIKRLFKTTDGRVRVVSDNPDKALFPDEFLSGSDLENVYIVGRVIDRSGRGGL